MLFVPAILTPKSQPLTSADMNVSIQTPQTAKPVASQTAVKPAQPIPAVPTLELASIGDGAEPIVAPPVKAEKPTETPVANAPKASITTPKDLVATVPNTPAKTPKKTSSAPLVPIKLESVGDDGNTKQSRASTAQKTPKTAKKSAIKAEKWLRVGSFSNLSNADKLAENLKRKKFSVKIENTKVSGKPFRRVLVGPFSSDAQMRKVQKQIRAEGFSPSVQ